MVKNGKVVGIIARDYLQLAYLSAQIQAFTFRGKRRFLNSFACVEIPGWIFEDVHDIVPAQGSADL